MAALEKDTRPFRGSTMYRWEGGQNLVHHCGICAVPLNHSRSKIRCVGKHVEPCYKYHPTLHLVGKAHECFSCYIADEMHHTRHKEILQLIRKINALDGIASTRSDDTPSGTSTPSGTDVESPTERVTKRQRKKLGNGVKRDRLSIESFPKEDFDFVSLAIHGEVMETKSSQLGTHDYGNVFSAAETANQEGAVQEPSDGKTKHEDDEAVVQPPKFSRVDSPMPNTARQRKEAKLQDQGKRGGNSRKYISPTAKSREDIYNGVDPAILTRLRVEVAPANNNRLRKGLVDKLMAAIKDDLGILKGEMESTVVREKGFWAWAGKSVYGAMAETRVEIDWATGQKKKNGA